MKSAFEKIADEIVEMLDKKFQAYGEDNLKIYGLLGVLVRMQDKLSRLSNQIFTDNMAFETIEDTLKDIAGYSIATLRLLRDKEITRFGIADKYLYKILIDRKEE